MTPTTAIIDGDIIAYRSAFWADSEGVEDLQNRINKDIESWTPQGCTDIIIAMSCPREKNYRRDFWPLYKQHREGRDSPESMPYAIESIYNVGVSVRCVNQLEADDLIGMLVSSGQAIGITVDKDLRQVPGWHWNPDKELEPTVITPEDADSFFYRQWMTGDSTDNIWGLWKVGPAKAKKLLENNPKEDWDSLILDMYLNEDWDRRPPEKVPELSKMEFALAQARCVRILRDGDYNKETCEVNLWSPNNQTVRNILEGSGVDE